MQAEADEELAKEKLISEITRKQSHLKADTLKKRAVARSGAPGLGQAVDRRAHSCAAGGGRSGPRDLGCCRRAGSAALKVTPGFSGVLQQVPVEVGQRVGPGVNLARVADPGRLKAELKIAETQAKDIEVGQIG